VSRIFFPLFMDLNGAVCLLVGGGAVSARKARALLEAGALLRIVAPEVIPELAGLDPARVQIRLRSYKAADLDGVRLAFAATDSEQVNRQVFLDARERGIPVNVADAPRDCTFILPAVFRDGSLCVAVSTGGASPSLAGRLRDRIRDSLGEEAGAWLKVLSELRPRILRQVSGERRRHALFKSLSGPDWIDCVRAEGIDAARRRAETLIHDAAAGPESETESRPE
jgi:precorrin-2 dehydrogenase/sirohydrochlorin ferrochelatase